MSTYLEGIYSLMCYTINIVTTYIGMVTTYGGMVTNIHTYITYPVFLRTFSGHFFAKISIGLIVYASKTH